MSRPRPWWAMPALALVPATAFVLARLPTADATYPTGASGSQFASHIERVELAISTRRLWEGAMGPLEWLRKADGEYPPVVVLTHSLLAAPFGQSMRASMLVGWLWVVLLAWAVAHCAGQLAREGAERRWSMAASATAVVSLAPLQMFSLRAYYDLPMLALFFAALALLLRARGWWPGVLAGGVALLACLAKWTALPLLLITGAGVLLHGLRADSMRRARLKALLGALAVLGTGLALWFSVVPQEHDPGSYAAMSGTFDPDPLSVPAADWVAVLLPQSLERAVARTNWFRENLGYIWHPFHFRWMVWSMLSPLVTLLLVPLWLRWLRGGLRGGAVLIPTFLGHWALLYFLVPVQDERFFLSGMVVAVLAATLGLAQMAPRWRAGAAVVVGGALLLVGAEFHFGHDGPSQEVDGPLARWAEPETWRLRSAYQPDLAWARGDEPKLHAPGVRAELLRWVEACDPAWVGLGDFDTERRQAPLLGEWRWWLLVFAMESKDTPDLRRQVTNADAQPYEVPFGHEQDRRYADLYVAPWRPGDEVRPPPGPASGDLRHVGTISPVPGEWDGGATLWLPPTREDCSP